MCPGIGGLHIPSVLLSTHLPHLLLVSPWCPVLKCQVSFSWHDWLFPSCCSSYLHCEWATISQLEKDKRIHQKLKRFKTKMAQMRHFFHEVIRTQYWLLLLSTVFLFFVFFLLWDDRILYLCCPQTSLSGAAITELSSSHGLPFLS